MLLSLAILGFHIEWPMLPYLAAVPVCSNQNPRDLLAKGWQSDELLLPRCSSKSESADELIHRLGRIHRATWPATSPAIHQRMAPGLAWTNDRGPCVIRGSFPNSKRFV